MSKFIIVLIAVLCISGCASPEQKRLQEENYWAQKRYETDRANEAREAARLRVNSYIERECAYAESDPVSHGDCQRQTRQHLAQQFQAEQAATQQAAAAKELRNAQIFQGLVSTGQQITRPYVYQATPPAAQPKVCRTNSLGGGQYETVCQ